MAEERSASHILRLPYRAGKIIPAEVARLLPAAHHPGILTKTPRKRRQKKIAGGSHPT